MGAAWWELLGWGLLGSVACGGGDRIEPLLARHQAALESGALDLPSESLTDAEIATVVASDRVRPFTQVTLGGNRLTEVGARTLLTSDKATGVTSLMLDANQLGDAGLTAVADDAPAGLWDLFVGSNAATSAGAMAIARIPRLHRLSVGGQPVSDGGAAALAAADAEIIEVSLAEVGGAGARVLLHGGRARTVDLSRNPIGPGGLQDLGSLAPGLEQVSIAHAKLDARDAAALAAANAPGLRHLDLSYNPLGDAGLNALAHAPWLATLQTLDVMGTGGSLPARAALRAAWGARAGLVVER
jgi:hypothetical protein